MAQDPMPAWSAMMAAWRPPTPGNAAPHVWSWMVPTMQDGARRAEGNGGATMPADPVQAWAEMVRWWQDALETSAAPSWPALFGPQQLAPGSAPSAVTAADVMTPAGAAQALKPMLDAIAASGPIAAYWLDASQRTVLTLDALRKRGNQSLEHKKSGKPPVLSFDYELVLDGRMLERPVNYQLLRIAPPPGATFDAKARPYIVFDPRAGHGPGIGGFKEASQVGVAMRGGHPVYFVSFLPQPVPGQTVEDVARAEVIFMEKVIELHPEAESAPAMVGNCQGGWGLMLAASQAPTLPGVISIAGAPLSYWGGRRGENPMRYTGGLAGGSWMASLTGDLGNGLFDGAYLVENFENLNQIGRAHV